MTQLLWRMEHRGQEWSREPSEEVHCPDRHNGDSEPMEVNVVVVQRVS